MYGRSGIPGAEQTLLSQREELGYQDTTEIIANLWVVQAACLQQRSHYPAARRVGAAARVRGKRGRSGSIRAPACPRQMPGRRRTASRRGPSGSDKRLDQSITPLGVAVHALLSKACLLLGICWEPCGVTEGDSKLNREGGFPQGACLLTNTHAMLVQEKQKASERHIEELSERVQALELEKRELQNALEKAKLAPKVREFHDTHGNPLQRRDGRGMCAHPVSPGSSVAV